MSQDQYAEKGNYRFDTAHDAAQRRIAVLEEELVGLHEQVGELKSQRWGGWALVVALFAVGSINGTNMLSPAEALVPDEACLQPTMGVIVDRCSGSRVMPSCYGFRSVDGMYAPLFLGADQYPYVMRWHGFDCVAQTSIWGPFGMSCYPVYRPQITESGSLDGGGVPLTD